MSDDAPKVAPVSSDRIELLNEQAERYQESLVGNLDALEYMERRGFDMMDLERFRIGLVESPEPGHQRFKGMLAIPYLRLGGVVQFRFRRIPGVTPGDGPKYLSMEGEPSLMFNTDALHEANGEIHLAEGELDCMTLAKCGLHAVGMPGANAWKWRHSINLAGFNRIYIWGDPDEAGGAFVNRVLRALRQARPVRLQADVNDTFLAGGVEEIMRRAEDAK